MKKEKHHYICLNLNKFYIFRILIINIIIKFQIFWGKRDFAEFIKESVIRIRIETCKKFYVAEKAQNFKFNYKFNYVYRFELRKFLFPLDASFCICFSKESSVGKVWGTFREFITRRLNAWLDCAYSPIAFVAGFSTFQSASRVKD